VLWRPRFWLCARTSKSTRAFKYMYHVFLHRSTRQTAPESACVSWWVIPPANQKTKLPNRRFCVRPAAPLGAWLRSPSRRAEPAGEPAGLLRMGLLPSASVTAVLLLSPSVAIFAASMSPEQQQQARVLDDQSSMRPPPAYPRPCDVLMIVVDDLRSQLSCSGPKGVDYAKVHTPHLCGLAEESLTLLRSQVATTTHHILLPSHT